MVELFSKSHWKWLSAVAVELAKHVFLKSFTTARMHHVSGAHGTVKSREGWTGRLPRK